MKRKWSAAGVAFLSAFVAFMLLAPTASGGTVPKTTGSVMMSYPAGPLYMTFNAFQATSTAPAKGNVSYTSFGTPMPGSGVWVPAGAFVVAFDNASSHTLTVNGFTPTSPTSVTFWGTGVYDQGPSFTETFTGSISGSVINLTLIPDGVSGWTSLTMTGAIAADGSVNGSWNANPAYASGSFTIAGVGYEALHYAAPVTAALITGSNATFDFTIPAWVFGVELPLTVSVHDGGSPGAGHDTIGWLGTDYPITGGNLTVFP